jgi:transcriptional regulator with PAS, ATPase and Fis domain
MHGEARSTELVSHVDCKSLAAAPRATPGYGFASDALATAQRALAMKQILFIAPYPEMCDTIAAVLHRYPRRDEIAYRVAVVPVDSVDDVPIELCDAIVARGYSARRLKRERPEVPVIEIEVAGYDVITSIQECLERFHSRSIAFVGFYGAFNGIRRFEGMFDCRINVYIPRDVNDLDNVLRQVRADGCDAVIGGYSAHARALLHGFNSIGLRSGEEAVGLALEEAVRSVEIIRQERIRAETYRIITQSVKNGIVYVDANGFIQVDNSVARSLAHCDLEARRLEEVFPFMTESFRSSLLEGRPITRELRRIDGTMVSLDCTPVVVEGRSGGVVITFRDVVPEPRRDDISTKKIHERRLVARHEFGDIVHRSDTVAEAIEVARSYARRSANLLIMGETGTGKELFAQSIHNDSVRRNGPFVAVNCATLPESLLESELFGYVEGAFTGTARGGKIGLFELAHNGTLFLDEISELPIGVQGKLLRVLQEQEVRRIGADRVIPVNVRVISATNTDLRDLVARGLFRRDLLYRLDVLSMWLPPLRDRGNDAAVLFAHFLNRDCVRDDMPVPRVDDAALEVLHGREFPGNVRELSNIAERVCALRRDPGRVTREDMERALRPESARRPSVGWSGDTTSPPHPLPDRFAEIRDDADRQATLQALAATKGHRAAAARLLGIDRSTLWRRLRKYHSA